jgi:hypothetical protein
MEAAWLFVLGWGLLVSGLVFWRSALRPRRGSVRVLLGIAALLATFLLFCVLFSYYDNYSFPWLVLIPVLAWLIVGGWVFRQRWLAVLLSAGVAYCAVAALLPPGNTTLPASQTVGGLTATLQPARRDNSGVCTCDFSLQTAPGTDLRMKYDIDRVGVSGRFWGFFPVDAWSPHEIPPELAGTRENEADLFATVFLPEVSRRYDLTLEVPPWPAKPDASVQIPFTPRGVVARGQSFTARPGPVTLRVLDVRWGPSETESPSEPCLKFSIDCSETPTPESWGGWEWRLSDAAGHLVHMNGLGGSGGMGTSEDDEEVFPPDGTVWPLTLDALSQDELDSHRVRFEFARLPNPRSE